MRTAIAPMLAAVLLVRPLWAMLAPSRHWATAAAPRSRIVTASTVDQAWDRDAWLEGWLSPQAEVAQDVGALPGVTGQLPDDLVGTYFRNGHAKFEVHGSPVLHPFDADGMVTAATLLGNGTCYFRNRFVRTKGLQKEDRSGKRLYPGQFGNPQAIWAGGLRTKNVANTNVIWWGQRLLALWEGGQPYKLDPLSLGTAGASSLAGVIADKQGLTAHPRYDAKNDRLVCYDYKPNPISGTALRLFEFDNTFRLWQNRIVDTTIPGVFGLFHDFAITERFMVFAASPQSFGDGSAAGAVKAGLGVLTGQTALAQSVTFDSEKPTKFMLFRRGADGGEEPIEIEVDTHFNFHFANAYENDLGQIVVDTVRADRMELGQMVPGKPIWETISYAEDVPASTLWRYVLDPSTATLVSSAQVCSRPLDFPVVNRRVSGQKHRFVWAATGSRETESAPPQGIIKIDTEQPEKTQVWLPPPHQFCGEPCFAAKQGAGPDSDEDEGYILTLIVDGQTKVSQLAVLDAADVAKGPLASVPLGVNIPHGLHGCWAESVAPSLEELGNAQVLLAMFQRKSKEWNQLDAAFSGLGISQFLGQKGMDGR